MLSWTLALHVVAPPCLLGMPKAGLLCGSPQKEPRAAENPSVTNQSCPCFQILNLFRILNNFLFSDPSKFN